MYFQGTIVRDFHFRHLRDDATAPTGGAAATAFMRLGNHREAAQAASFIGRHHSFTISGWPDIQRVYEYAVEPAVLQNLPGSALLLPARGTVGPGLLAVECDPRIITLPGAATSPAAGDYHQFPWCSGTSLTSGSASTSSAANTRNTCAWTRPG